LGTSILPIIQHAFHLSWTRDPFDRLLAAHSLTVGIPSARSIPFSCDTIACCLLS
jgi:hypothetical protein